MSSFGKKNKNPGYQAGDNWVACDSCGFVIRASSIKETWDGRMLCPEDWEARHEQDFVRSRNDKIAADIVRPENEDLFLIRLCKTVNAIAGEAIADCARCDNATEFSESIPAGTFNTNTL